MCLFSSDLVLCLGVFERSCLYEAGKGSNGNGNRPSDKPLGTPEQYIERQKATIELIPGGARSRSLGGFAAGSTRSET